MLDFCLEEPDLGLVTPYGIPLERYWAEKSRGLYPSSLYDAAYTIVRKLADGVAALHATGAAHRDLKPPNVVIVNGEHRIIDLGVVDCPEYEADDVTGLDGRRVENGPIPYYWKDKERDIVGLAWIYGLLIEKPGVRNIATANGRLTKSWKNRSEPRACSSRGMFRQDAHTSGRHGHPCGLQNRFWEPELPAASESRPRHLPRRPFSIRRFSVTS